MAIKSLPQSHCVTEKESQRLTVREEPENLQPSLDFIVAPFLYVSVPLWLLAFRDYRLLVEIYLAAIFRQTIWSAGRIKRRAGTIQSQATRAQCTRYFPPR